MQKYFSLLFVNVKQTKRVVKFIILQEIYSAKGL